MVSRCASFRALFSSSMLGKQGREELLTAPVERGSPEGTRSWSKESYSRPCPFPSFSLDRDTLLLAMILTNRFDPAPNEQIAPCYHLYTYIQGVDV